MEEDAVDAVTRQWALHGADCFSLAALRTEGARLLHAWPRPESVLAAVASALRLYESARACSDREAAGRLARWGSKSGPARLAVWLGLKGKLSLLPFDLRAQLTRAARQACEDLLPEVPSAIAELLLEEAGLASAQKEFRTAEERLTRAASLDLAKFPLLAGTVWRDLGVLARHNGAVENAVTALESAMELLHRAGDAAVLADCGMSLGNALTEAGRYPQAEAAFLAALVRFTEMGHETDVEHENDMEHDKVPAITEDRSRCMMNLGVLYRRRGRHWEAYEILYEALTALAEREMGQTLPVRRLRFRLMANIANCCYDLRRYEDAFAWGMEASGLLDQLMFEHPHGWERDRAEISKSMAVFAGRLGQSDLSSRWHQSAVDSLREQFGADPATYGESYAQALLDQAHFVRRKGEARTAELIALSSLQVLRGNIAERGVHACEDWLAAAKIVLRARLDCAGVFSQSPPHSRGGGAD